MIVEPSLSVCAELLELILTPIGAPTANNKLSKGGENSGGGAGINTDNNTIPEEGPSSSVGPISKSPSPDPQNPSQAQRVFIKKPWIQCMIQNKKIWREQEAAGN